MYKSINRARSGEAGFTLIELLIVIVILGILSAVVVFAVGGIQDRGRKSACKSDVKTIEVAQEAYYAKNSAYAGDAATLVSAKLIKSAPAGDGYSISTDSTGVVTASPLCTSL